MSRWAIPLFVAGTVCVVAILSCGSSSDGETTTKTTTRTATADELHDSKVCSACHPNHYREWSGSMHAYASDDPLFRAMNRRMQRETNGALGTFCIQCHAPMAVKLGKTKDGLDIDAMPELKGVTCYFCHAVVGVEGSSNNPLRLATEPVMGGAIRDPIERGRNHQADYVSWLDGTRDNSSGLCGSCHDIVTPGGAHIERTFAEWKDSRFAVGEQTKTSCAACHLPARDGHAAELTGAPQRRQHDHSMPGVDLALTEFPEREAQRAAVQKLLDDVVHARVCVTATSSGATIDVALANRTAGHAFPSGSNQDRRAWIQLAAYAGGATILSTGDVPADTSVEKARDPLLFLLRDHVFDKDGAPTELFWRAASFDSMQLPAQVTSNPATETSVHKTYAAPRMPDRVTMQVNIRPIDYDLIEELERSGDLDPRSIAPPATMTLAKTKLEWTAASGPCVE